MGVSSLTSYTLEEIGKWTLQQSSDELPSSISQLLPEQIGAVIGFLREDFDPHWREKIGNIVLKINDLEKLEIIGKALNPDQALEILDQSQKWDLNLKQSKLPTLFVKMPHSVFQEMLKNASTPQIEILKHESITEPIQHHITHFIHETALHLEEYGDVLIDLEKEIQGLEIREISSDIIDSFRKKFEGIHHFYLEASDNIQKYLIIAWNTNRIDLIEKLSKLKEAVQKTSQQVIGVPGSIKISTSGLYLALEKRLNEIFGNVDDPTDFDALADEDPAIEALVKFSIWYLKDYFEVGLLPSIRSKDQLEMDPAVHSEKECLSYREKLFNEVEQNLHKLGLHTLKDLKDGGIYSKKALISFIQKNIKKINE